MRAAGDAVIALVYNPASRALVERWKAGGESRLVHPFVFGDIDGSG